MTRERRKALDLGMAVIRTVASVASVGLNMYLFFKLVHPHH